LLNEGIMKFQIPSQFIFGWSFVVLKVFFRTIKRNAVIFQIDIHSTVSPFALTEKNWLYPQFWLPVQWLVIHNLNNRHFFIDNIIYSSSLQNLIFEPFWQQFWPVIQLHLNTVLKSF
jgi:hypothetical protein